MTQPIDIILARYPLLSRTRVQSLGSAGGLSGAQFWKLHLDSAYDSQTFCLRRWPRNHPSRAQLEWIHLVLKQVWGNGCAFVPKPLTNQLDQTFLELDGWLWEISPWMPGLADANAAKDENRLLQMMFSLAKFHQAAAQIHLDFRPSEGLLSRLKQLLAVPDLVQNLKSQAHSMIPGLSHEVPLLQKVQHLRSQFVQCGVFQAERLLADFPGQCDKTFKSTRGAVDGCVLPLQPVIRDVWWDHVLFTENQVTGLVDFGGMKVDSVAFDISRLLGSCLGQDDSQFWQKGIAAYQQQRPQHPLTELEFRLIPWLDQTGVLLAVAHWLCWLWLEQRTFENIEKVKSRIDHLWQRFQEMSEM